MANENILMPKLGESVTEGTIEKWLVKPGDHVNKYDPLAEVNTDKVNAEIPSSFSGTIRELIAAEGETLQVGDVVCIIETSGEGVAQPTTMETAPENEGPANEMPAETTVKPETSSKDEKVSARGRYSPAVLRLSQEHDIDLSLVEGTGRGGRITRKDLLTLIKSGEIPKGRDAVPTAGQGSSTEAKQGTPITASASDVEIPVTGIRRAIANNMVRAKQEVPHAWMTVEVDVTNLVSYRDSLKTGFKNQEGFNLTYFAFFVKAVAQALKEFPMMNSMWAGDKIIQKKEVNISIAVATDDALFVPVIQHADEKTIKSIGRDIHELATKVRAGKLQAEDMQGGTFTVNNTGSFGSVHSAGIINYPQAAILQVESIVKRPVVIDGMIGIRDMVNLCLSLDHRVLDGLVCGRFLARVKEILENISAENTSVY